MLRVRIKPAAGLALTGIVFLGIAGCGGGDGTEAGEAADLSGRSFVSSEAWSGEGSAFSRPVTVSFDPDGKSMGWVAECNQAGAGVTFTGDQLTIGEVASTAMGCEPAAERQDRDLAEFFRSDPTWHLDGDRLTLSNESGEVQLAERAGRQDQSPASAVGIPPGSPSEIDLAVAPEYEAGKLVVAQSGCLACHRFGGSGHNGPGPDLTDVGAEMTAAEIGRAVVQGPGIMPSYRALEGKQPEKFAAMVAFLASLDGT